MEASDMLQIHEVGSQVTQLRTIENPIHPELPTSFIPWFSSLDLERAGSYFCGFTEYNNP